MLSELCGDCRVDLCLTAEPVDGVVCPSVLTEGIVRRYILDCCRACLREIWPQNSDLGNMGDRTGSNGFHLVK